MTDMDASVALKAAATEARRWLFEEAAPIWSTAGFRDGMFVEQIGLDGKAPVTSSRARVQPRQIYSFCELGRLGWTGPWRDRAERALDRFLAVGQREDGFFVHTFSADGVPLDRRADLYDHAFVLFCFAHAARALNRDSLLESAKALFGKLTAWRHPLGGFREGEIDGPPRRQNPHMHLLEASLALWEVSRDPFWKTQALEIVTLCRERFLDRDTGALVEFFTDDWRPVPGDAGRKVEPGHCFEWAWLFERLNECGIADGAGASDRLVAFARSTGIDRTRGVAVNATNLDGIVEDPAARLWPQTERMKAALARFRRTRDMGEAREAVAAFAGLQRYFDTPVEGLWRDVMRRDGSFVDQAAPASSFYHIVCGIADLIATAFEPLTG
jgi:mannose/cellobiose epimerase-like protein (N-acyl-D-glucosamine 2-epimerase family)